jgi:hypothetical protein
LVRRRAWFFESYAQLLDERAATTPAATIGIDDARADWLDDAERATALRQAGQFELLVDQQHARSLLLDAAQSYLRAGVPYGHFLATAFSVDVAPPILFSGPGRLVWPLVHASQAVSPPTTEPTEPPEPGPLGPDALLDWVQQAYVYLVVNAHRPLWQEFRHVIAPLRSAPQASAVSPVGPQSVPLRSYWQIGNLFGDLHEEREEARRPLLSRIAAIARRYEDAINQARQNEYLWSSLQSPVEVVDLDIAGISALADIALEQASMPRFDFEEAPLSTLSAVAQIPIRAGIILRGGFANGRYPHPEGPPR